MEEVLRDASEGLRERIDHALIEFDGVAGLLGVRRTSLGMGTSPLWTWDSPTRCFPSQHATYQPLLLI